MNAGGRCDGVEPAVGGGPDGALRRFADARRRGLVAPMLDLALNLPRGPGGRDPGATLRGTPVPLDARGRPIR